MNKYTGFLFIFYTLFSVTLFGQLTLTTDRPDANYEVGESMNFIVSGGSGTANYVIHYDHGVTPAIASGTIQLNGGSTRIPFQINEPSVVICTVLNNGQVGIAGAAFSPFNIQPFEADPFDFDSFWQNQKNELSSVPINARITPLIPDFDTRTRDYRINLGQVDGRRVYGYLSIPDRPGTFPAVISHAAFGVGPNICVPRPEIAADIGVISLSIWMHDGEPDTQVANAYFPKNWETPSQNYFRYGVLGILRAIDYIYTMPEFRGQGIGLNGISEGGGMSILAAGIDSRVNAVSASIHAHSDHSGFKYGRASGFPYYLFESGVVNQGVFPESINQGAKYFDAVRGAKRFDGGFLGAVGYIDQISIPATNFSTYNQLKGSTVLIHKLKGGHQNPQEYYLGKFEFFRKEFGLSGEKGFSANAGFDQTLNNQDAFLSGVIEKNGSNNFSLPVEWEKISGPGNVSFSNKNNRNTSASFSESGEYILRITATDKSMLASTQTFYTISDHVKITVSGNNAPTDIDGDGYDNTVDCNDFNASIGSPGTACNDGNPNTQNDVLQSDCSCAGTLIAPCANNGGDSDGDGICNDVDCNDFNPTISSPGDACNDGNPNTQNDVIQANCNCAGTFVAPCANNGGDSDGDGICNDVDCNDFNPTISSPGDACNDGNPNTQNDVIQANCNCAGTFVAPCANNGGDSDGDGICNDVDCNDFNPTISSPGDACNDGNPNTQNDVIQANCNCAGTFVAPCANNGGDSDGDGICNDVDCNDFNPTISSPGDACNDGNPNTQNDVIQANCNCAGTTITPPPPSGCNASFSLDGLKLTVEPLDDVINFVKVYDPNFNLLMSCEEWGNTCDQRQEFTLPRIGDYVLQILTYSDWNTEVCNVIEYISAQGGTITNPPTTQTCDNLRNGGQISGEESICMNEMPSPILSSRPPRGGSGAIEYLWLSSDISCPNSLSDSIPGAHSSTFELGQLSQTTYFRRLSRRAGCTDWFLGISNCIAKNLRTDCDDSGTTTPPTGGCDAQYSLSGSRMNIQNVNQPIATVKILEQISGGTIYECNNFANPCPTSISVNMTPGKYFIQIITGEDWGGDYLCNIFDQFEVPITQNRINESANVFSEGIRANEFAKSNKNQSTISIFPNPASDFIQVSINDISRQAAKIELLNQLGKVEQTGALSEDTGSNILTFSTEKLAAGIYFVKVYRKGEQPVVKKIFVK